ncbi:MAG: hypothetical protein Ct9H300mP32_1790 [Verrucomicrobiota bacterium]|nr:MAG: hypothetical protein Ct9H300mP32_1790 [Verrucomicrobiota bacterium]
MDFFKPVKPDTIAKSLAIGTPADGFYALKVMKETGGASDDVTDDEIREAMSALAECEGIFTETAGGRDRGRGQETGCLRQDSCRGFRRALRHWQRPQNARCRAEAFWQAG